MVGRRQAAAAPADEIQDIVADHYAMVTLVDDEVGRILDELDAQGLADDTVATEDRSRERLADF